MKKLKKLEEVSKPLVSYEISDEEEIENNCSKQKTIVGN